MKSYLDYFLLKHEGLIVDVKELPDVAGSAITVISINLLDDLIAKVENLLKPVLHKTEEEQHTYCVIDNMMKYEYISKLYLLTKDNLPNNEWLQP